MNEAKRSMLLKIMLVLSVIGFGVTAYQTYEHYFLASSVCDFTASFSCSLITESRYGEFPPDSGIATAGWGILWWGGLIALLYGSVRGKDWFKLQEFYIFIWMLIGMLFVVYLLAVEFYILPLETGEILVCPLCTVQGVLIIIILALSFLTLRKPIKNYLEEIFYVEK